MKKIPTLFERDWDGDRRYVLPQVNPECAWVLQGEGVPTRKYDGTCVMFDGDRWWARREIKPGKAEPDNFMYVSADAETGKVIGWEPIEQSAFARWHTEALGYRVDVPPAGTYELIGPKVNGNPEKMPHHILQRHAQAEVLTGVPLNFTGLAEWLHAHSYEGIVWHHQNGPMAKIKKRDFRAPSGK